MLATAAAVVANPLDKVFGAEDTEGRKAGPNDQIRIACIGFHAQGSKHIGAYLHMKDVTIATSSTRFAAESTLT